MSQFVRRLQLWQWSCAANVLTEQFAANLSIPHVRKYALMSSFQVSFPTRWNFKKNIHLSWTNAGHVGIVLFSSTCLSPCAQRGEAINSGQCKCFQIRASWMPDLLSQSSALNNSGNRKTWGVVNYRDAKTVEHGKQIFSWWGYKQSRKHEKGYTWPNSVACNLFMASPDRSRALTLGITVCMFVFRDGNGLTFVCL